MTIEIIVPQIGEAVAELQLASWLKNEGDYVHKGEPLFEVDSDKAIVEVEAFEEGTLLKILVPTGSAVMPQDVVGLFAPAGESPSLEATPTATPIRTGAPLPEKEPSSVSPVARRMAADLNVDLETVIGTGPSGKITVSDIRQAAARQLVAHRDESAVRPGWVLASPRARVRARELSVSLSGMTGSGVEGMIVVQDVEQAANALPMRQTPPSPPTTSKPLSRQRAIIASRMLASKQNVPHFYLMVDVDMSRLEELRTYCRENLAWQQAPTYTDLVVRACALALAEMPEVNVSYTAGSVTHYQTIDIGVAVALDDGLIVPVIRQADTRSLVDLSENLRALAARARNGRLRADDLGQKSMVVSNLGMYGIDAFVAIIDMPDPMILAVGRVTEKVIPINGQIAIRPMCTFTLSVDHRVLDGSSGAKFLARVRDHLENPFQLMG